MEMFSKLSVAEWFIDMFESAARYKWEDIKREEENRSGDILDDISDEYIVKKLEEFNKRLAKLSYHKYAMIIDKIDQEEKGYKYQITQYNDTKIESFTRMNTMDEIDNFIEGMEFMKNHLNKKVEKKEVKKPKGKKK